MEKILLKIIMILITTIITIISFYIIPQIVIEGLKNSGIILLPIALGLTIATATFYIIMYNLYKILNHLKEFKIYLKDLKNITLINLISLIAILPFMYLYAEIDDAPGIIVLNSFLILVSLIIYLITRIIKKEVNTNVNRK